MVNDRDQQKEGQANNDPFYLLIIAGRNSRTDPQADRPLPSPSSHLCPPPLPAEGDPDSGALPKGVRRHDRNDEHGLARIRPL